MKLLILTVVATAVFNAFIWLVLMHTSGPKTFRAKDLFRINWGHHGPKTLTAFLFVGALAGLGLYALIKFLIL